MLQPSGLGGLQIKPGAQPQSESSPVLCGTTGTLGSFVGCGQVKRSVMVTVVWPPVTVWICVMPGNVVRTVFVTTVTTPGRVSMEVVPGCKRLASIS